jgi:hypothetical protein
MMKRLRTALRLTDETRVTWLTTITVFGFVAAILLTLPQWTLDRTYPLTPIVPGFLLPNAAHVALTMILVGGMVFGLRSRHHRALGFTLALVSLAILTLADLIRFHPWALHYSGILFVIAASLWLRKHDSYLLDAARVVVGGIYFWSGVQKMNVRFVAETFPWFTRPLWEFHPESLLPLFMFLGLTVPVVEAAFAVGFFSKRFRTISIIGSTAMILLVLSSIGPFGHSWNSSVWPWNVAIFAMVITLFWKAEFTFLGFVRRVRHSVLALLMFAIFWVMPLGNPFGLVDHYLSWSLYSGHVPEATLRGDPAILSALSERADGNMLQFTEWTLDQMNNVPYPEERLFRTVFAAVCTRFDGDESLQLDIRTFPDYFDTAVVETLTYSCSDM